MYLPTPTPRKKTRSRRNHWLALTLCLSAGVAGHAQTTQATTQPSSAPTPVPATPAVNQASLEYASGLLLVRVDPSVFPSEPQAIASLIRSEHIFGKAAQETLSSQTHDLVLKPIATGERGLSLIQIHLGHPSSGEADACIQDTQRRLQVFLSELTQQPVNEARNRQTEAMHQIEHLNEQKADIEQRLVAISQWTTARLQADQRQQAIREAQIQITAIEAQRAALLEAMKDANVMAQRKAEQDQTAQQLQHVQRELSQRLQKLRNAGQASSQELQELESQLTLTQAELFKHQEQVIQHAFDGRPYQEKLLALSVRQAELQSKVEQQWYLVEEHTASAQEHEERDFVLQLRLREIEPKLKQATETHTDMDRRIRAIIQPMVQLIR